MRMRSAYQHDCCFVSFLLLSSFRLLVCPPAPLCVALEYCCETDAEGSVSANAAMSLDELVFLCLNAVEVGVKARWRELFFTEKMTATCELFAFALLSHESPVAR